MDKADISPKKTFSQASLQYTYYSSGYRLFRVSPYAQGYPPRTSFHRKCTLAVLRVGLLDSLFLPKYLPICLRGNYEKVLTKLFVSVTKSLDIRLAIFLHKSLL